MSSTMDMLVTPWFAMYHRPSLPRTISRSGCSGGPSSWEGSSGGGGASSSGGGSTAPSPPVDAPRPQEELAAGAGASDSGPSGGWSPHWSSTACSAASKRSKRTLRMASPSSFFEMNGSASCLNTSSILGIRASPDW